MPDMERRRFVIGGIVQGVGFRPFVYGLARRHGLGGFVLNDASGVVVEAEGPAGSLDAFALALRAESPELARVDALQTERIVPLGETAFSIAASRSGGRRALIPPTPMAPRSAGTGVGSPPRGRKDLR